MACDVPADVAAARAAQADAAVEAKNTDAEQRAALAGQSGVVAGLEATAKTGRPDFLLAQPWVWLVGAMLAAALTETPLGKVMGVLAVALAAVNVFGGFLVTRRMLEMFRKKERKA